MIKLYKKMLINNLNDDKDLLNKLRRLNRNNEFITNLFNYDYTEEEIYPSPISLKQGKKL